jgi:hypothetical protein
VLEIPWHFSGRDGGPVDHRAGRQRLAVVEDAFADLRIDAVGADQSFGRDAFAALQRDRHAGIVEIEIHDAAIIAKLDQIVRAAGIEQRAVDVGAMRHRVRIAETLAEVFTARDVGDLGAGDGVHHQQPLDQQCVFLGGNADTERVKHRKRVGCDLETEANLAEFARLFQHERTEAVARQRQRAGKAADAAACDRNRM